MAQDSQKFKICVVGDINVGKSCMLNRLRTGQFSQRHSTIGAELEIQRVQYEGKQYTLSIWDTAGAEKFRSMVRTYYRGAVAALIVYDVTNRNSFLGVDYWFENLKMFETSITTIVLCGNKVDLVEHREVSASEGSTKAEELGMTAFFETSAISGQNLEEAFMEIVKGVHEKNSAQQMLSPRHSIVQLDKTKKKHDTNNKSCGC